MKVSANAIGGGDVGDTISIDREDPLPSSQSSQSSAATLQSSQSETSADTSKKKRKQKEKPIKRQTRQLKNYIYNLFERFVFQNSHAPVKSTTFYALRPENIQVVSYIKMSSCICEIYQNFAHLVESLSHLVKPMGHSFQTEPDVFLQDVDQKRVAELLKLIPEGADVKYKMWKHEKDPYCNNGTRKQLVDRSMPQVWYTKYFDKEATFFRRHVWRIKEQYVHQTWGRVQKVIEF